MSKHMNAKRFSETFYQHDLVLVPTRKSWERLCRLSLRTWEVEPYLVGDIAAEIWEMHHA